MAITVPATLLTQVATQTSTITFTAITNLVEAEAALDSVINLIGSESPANDGLYLDKLDPAARLSILAILMAMKAAI